MEKYEISYWLTREFEVKPETVYVYNNLEAVYDIYYDILEQELPERIELYQIDKNGESILMDRLTCVN